MANFDGRPGVLPITAYYKGTFGMVFAFTSGGSAYSLVGASATFIIYEKNGTAALSLSSGSGLTINGAAGTITLSITNAQIVFLSTQEYNYELILTLSGGSVWPVLDSVFRVSEDGQASYSGDTITVALDGNTIALTIVPAAGDVGGGGGISDGDTLATGLTLPNTGLHILDTNATHDLIVAPGSNLTADRTLTVTTGDADRTLTISGDTTLSGGTHSGTNTGDQTITLSGDVSGSGTGAITATISALDAAKIADGSVSNTEFQYLNGVTSALQTQLDGKVDENAGITGATKTKITYDAKGLVTAGADATTADIADSSNKRYVTDAQLTVIGNTSGTNTGDQTITLSGDVSGSGTGAITATISALDAAKIADGSVSNTEFQYLNGVTSAIQTQLGAKQPLDATLTALAGLTIAADSLSIGTGADAFSQTSFAANTFPAKASTGSLAAKTITDFGLSLVDDANAAAGRTTLGAAASGANTDITSVYLDNAGLKLKDTNATHGLIISPGSNLTADRTLTVTTGDAARTLTISGDTTLSGGTHSGTNTGDQTITLSGDVSGSGTGAITATISALDAAKIADGSVSNTEFQYLNGVTSALQTQLDGKVDENAAITGATKTKITYDAKGLVTAGADATTADIADSSNKRYVTDAQLTVIGNTSGTNTGDQNTFSTIAVSGQSNVVADLAADTLTIAAGNNITITTNATTDTVTIAAGSVSADTIFDAKGDLVAGSGANAAQKLTVGTDAQMLYADSAQTVGLRWGPSIISPSQITADQDNYAPTGWASAQIVRVDGDSSIRAITSMSAGYSGETKQIVNVGSYPIYFPGEHPDGTAANRILTGGIDHILLPGDAINVTYDGTSSRWRIPIRRNEIIYPKSIFYRASGGSNTSGDWGDLSFGGTSVATSVSPRHWTLSTSTSTTGASYIGFSKTITDIATFGAAHMYFQAMISIDTLSTGTETFEFDLSITSDMTAFPYPNNSIGIRYTHSVNSGKFQLYSKDAGGSVAVADSGVTVATSTIYGLRIDIDKSRSEIRGYIDNVPVGRIASGLPSATDAGVRVAINKSAGSTARVVRVYSLAACFIFP